MFSMTTAPLAFTMTPVESTLTRTHNWQCSSIKLGESTPSIHSAFVHSPPDQTITALSAPALSERNSPLICHLLCLPAVCFLFSESLNAPSSPSCPNTHTLRCNVFNCNVKNYNLTFIQTQKTGFVF